MQTWKASQALRGSRCDVDRMEAAGRVAWDIPFRLAGALPDHQGRSAVHRMEVGRVIHYDYTGSCTAEWLALCNEIEGEANAAPIAPVVTRMADTHQGEAVADSRGAAPVVGELAWIQ